MKYYNNNLVYAYSIYQMVCTAIVAIAGMLTLYIVVSNYRSYDEDMKRTYVYSSNGSSIEVNLKPRK